VGVCHEFISADYSFGNDDERMEYLVCLNTMLNIFVNSLILAFITVPFFITWDRWYDFIEKIFLTRSAG